MFSLDIYTKIALFTGERTILDVMYSKNMIEPEVYNHIHYFGKILIHGKVQSGKTAAIIDVIQNPVYNEYKKILIIQNTLLVLNQYISRLTSVGIDFQVVDNKTQEITADVVILMNNKYRREKYKKIGKTTEKYIVILDECDVYFSHELCKGASCEYYVTATPYISKYIGFFDRVIELNADDDYHGFANINIEYLPQLHMSDMVVTKFMQDTQQGLLLMNDLTKTDKMQLRCRRLSRIFKGVPFICLNSRKRLFMNGNESLLRKRSICHIIDIFKTNPHIVIVANRLSLRGLSYTSSDYTRHITHQYSKYKYSDRRNLTNYIQKMRIFGKYKNRPNLTLMVSEMCEKVVNKMINISNTHIDSKELFKCERFNTL